MKREFLGFNVSSSVSVYLFLMPYVSHLGFNVILSMVMNGHYYLEVANTIIVL
jgi:hypothetical protein